MKIDATYLYNRLFSSKKIPPEIYIYIYRSRNCEIQKSGPDNYLMKLRSFLSRFSCSPLALTLDRPNLMTISGDFHRGCLLTFESVSLSAAELSMVLKAWVRPNLMKEELMVLRLSLDASASSLRSSMPCLLTIYSNSFDGSLKILKVPSSFSGARTEEDTSAQLQKNAIALKVQSAIYE